METAEIAYSASALWGYGLETVFCLCWPLFLFFFLRKKFGGFKVKPLLIGFGTYFAVSLVRAVFRALVLTDGVREIPALFYFLSALLSGVLEELGRYLALKYALDGFDGFRDAFSYGIGHGGCEMMLGIMSVALTQLYRGLRCNKVGVAVMTAGLDPDRAAAFAKKLAEGADHSFLYSLITVISWIVPMHCALSVLVLISVHYVGQKKLLYAAMGIHTFTDILPPLVVWLKVPLPMTTVAAAEILIILYIRRIWKRMNEDGA